MKPNKSFVYCTNGNRRKILFETEKKAENFMKFNNEEIKKESGYSPQRSYYCIFCNGWHLTSKKVLRHEKSKKEKLVEQYTQEHGRKNVKNRDISQKIDILKCEITDFSKKEEKFEKYKELAKRKKEIKSKEEIEELRIIGLKRKNRQIEKDNIREKRDYIEKYLTSQIEEMSFEEKELFFLKNIESKKEEIKLLSLNDIDDKEYLKIYLDLTCRKT